MLKKLSDVIDKSEVVIVRILSKFVEIVFSIIWTIIWLPIAVIYSFQKSYYPEKPRKLLVVRIFDNLGWVLRYQRINKFYMLYGLDIKGSKLSEYKDEKGFWKDLKRLRGGGVQHNHTCLLRDKYLFYKYMNSNSIKSPRVLFVYKEGQLYDDRMNEKEISDLQDCKNYFFKSVDGECASFVKHIDDYDGFNATLSSAQNGMYILQEAVTQHPELNRLNPFAINTLRVITMYNNGEPRVFSAILRVGQKKSGFVDNWAAGGLAIGVKEDGRLCEYGFYKPRYGLKTNIHPDTKICFSDFVVPYFKDALEIACNAHKAFYGIEAIGWDIAISNEGPCFIEGNDNFELSLMQACHGGLREQWDTEVLKALE